MALDVGVVLPVYGDAPFLAEALDSVLEQSAAPAQVVVVDDGSPVPVELPARHAGCCEVLRVGHGGPGAARAAGIARLHTGLVAFCDADDAWEPGSLAVRVQALVAAPQAALCFGRAVIVGKEGGPTGERWPEPAPGLHHGRGWLEYLYATNPILTSSVVARHAALAGLELDPGPRRAEDWDLWLQLAAREATFVFEPRGAVRYRRHGAALTAGIASLARDQMKVHERHRAQVDPQLARRVRAADLTALGHGLMRERRYREARQALREAAALRAPSPRDRAVRLASRVPVLRRRLGARDPYR